MEREADVWTHRLAWHAANIINNRTPAMGERRRRPVTVDQLLGKRDTRPQFSSAAEFHAHMRQRIEEAYDD